jgi:hypothetical protein
MNRSIILILLLKGITIMHKTQSDRAVSAQFEIICLLYYTKRKAIPITVHRGLWGWRFRSHIV